MSLSFSDKAARARATAAGGAVKSAMRSSSEGPAGVSMPQKPLTCRLASATKALPGPTMRATRGTVRVP